MDMKEIEGLVGVYVTPSGHIYKKDSEGKFVELKQTLIPKGLMMVYVWKDGKAVGKMVHRVVADAFLPKVDGKNQIGHLDGNKTNNNVENLVWMTKSELMKHSGGDVRSGMARRGRKLSQEHKLKISDSHTGVKRDEFSDETKRKMAISGKRAWRNRKRLAENAKLMSVWLDIFIKKVEEVLDKGFGI